MRWLGWFFAVVAVGLAAARLGLAIDDTGGPPIVAGVRAPDPRLATTLSELLMIAVFGGIGAFLAARRPGNPIGWLLIVTGFSFGAVQFSERLGWHLLVADGGLSDRAAFCLWLADWVWIGAVTPIFIFIPVLFPTGRPATPRWGRFLRAVVALIAVFVLLITLAAGELENYPTVENPFGVAAALATPRDVVFMGIVAAAIASVASVLMRFRRASGVVREQIKWMWAGGALLVLCFGASIALDSVHPQLASDVQFIGLLAIPAAIAIAILRYRLFDVDVVVNRTLVYLSLTAALALVYLGGVLLFGVVLAPITADSGLAVAVSTLAVAGLFRPVRARIQAIVDRRFYRRKYDAVRTLEGFSARLRDELDLDALVGELGLVLDQTMQPAHISLWLRPRA